MNLCGIDLFLKQYLRLIDFPQYSFGENANHKEGYWVNKNVKKRNMQKIIYVWHGIL